MTPTIHFFTQQVFMELLVHVLLRGFPGGSASKESTCSAGDLGSIHELGSSPGEGNGYPLQYSDLENSKDCRVHGVAKTRTGLSGFHFHFRYESGTVQGAAQR